MNQNLNLEFYVRKIRMSDLYDRSDLIRDFLNFVVPGLVGFKISKICLVGSAKNFLNFVDHCSVRDFQIFCSWSGPD